MVRVAVGADSHGTLTSRVTSAPPGPLKIVDWRTIPAYASSSTTAGTSTAPVVVPSPSMSTAGSVAPVPRKNLVSLTSADAPVPTVVRTVSYPRQPDQVLSSAFTIPSSSV